ncbi:hypothetical protein H2200_001163 [Cladophialophora chaetospira]|uniref:Benzoate 4-monooxygenase cytochrome P450 n=1 Tax=Cladophialophora chaetospira TaxID=386627 RepID=A0AA38XKC8_9EURO|nr:hypothetical protein H2200_001163 [Cladophialophora chaetospira]
MSSTFSFFTSAFAVLALLSFVLFTYRLYFHPLANIPGPLGNKITGWAQTLVTQSGRRHVWLFELHQKYGPVVRLTPNTVSINTATALKDIYGSRKASVRKGQFYQAVQSAEGAPTTFSERNEALHATKRRLLSHAFSERAIQDSEQYVSANINIWLNQLGAGPLSSNGWTAEKNVATWVNYLTFDILADLAYGRSFEMLTKKDMRFVAELIPGATHGVYIVGWHPLTQFLRWFLYRTPIGAWLAGDIIKDMQRLTEVSGKFVAERRSLEMSGDNSSTPARKDFFFHLFRGKDPETGQAFSDGELMSESNLLLVAGSDTTATTLSACMFYLVRHPHVLQNLRHELESNFSSLGDIKYTGTRLSTLPYLRAVIDESLRLNPPVGSTLGRDVIGSGINIDDFYYPPGVSVGVPIYALHHNSDYFPDPHAFKPERWIVNEKAGITKEIVDRAQSAFCPFSIGQRGCIGKNLAYLELSLAVARCVWRYDLEEIQGWGEKFAVGFASSKEEYTTLDGFVAQKNGPVLRFRDRKG